MTAQFDERMAGLRARFLERASTSALGLRVAFQADDMTELVRLAHVLAGSAGLFGHPEIGTAASEVELAAENEDRAALDRLMPDLTRLLDAAAQGR